MGQYMHSDSKVCDPIENFFFSETNIVLGFYKVPLPVTRGQHQQDIELFYFLSIVKVVV